MASLMGLLLGATEARRRELARHWAVEEDVAASRVVHALFRRITDGRSLQSFVERLPIDQRMVLDQIAAAPDGTMSLQHLLRQVPFGEPRASGIIAGLCNVVLLSAGDDGSRLAVPDDLLPLLRRVLRQGASAWADSLAESGSLLDSKGSQGGAGKSQPAAVLREVEAPAFIAPAGDALLEDIARIVDCVANGLACFPAGIAGPRPYLPARYWDRLGLARGDRLATVRLGYAVRCARSLGLILPSDGRWQASPAAGAWRELDHDRQARAVYEVWLSDRDWQEPVSLWGAGRSRVAITRLDRVRQRLRLWLCGAEQGVWYGVRSLLEVAEGKAARDRSARAAYGRRVEPRAMAPGAGRADAVVAVLAIGFYWLGGVDVGKDEKGVCSAFRLTQRGVGLLGLAASAIDAPHGDARAQGAAGSARCLAT